MVLSLATIGSKLTGHEWDNYAQGTSPEPG